MTTPVLVPVDLKAFVVLPQGPETTVNVTGGAGDPPPFAPGTPRPAGVHLHWAMPDSLLAGRLDPEQGSLVFPTLPHFWTVVRVLQPEGTTQLSLQVWRVDSRVGTVMPVPVPAGFNSGTVGVPQLPRLDAQAGGSLMWTASAWASRGRFTLHDPCAGLPNLAHQAVYSVVGSWEVGADPLAGATPATLGDRLAELGWSLPGGPGSATAFTTVLHGSVLGVPMPRPGLGPTLPADDRPQPTALSLALGHDLDDVVAAFGSRALTSDPERRATAERIVAAFTSGLIDQLGSTDGLEDLAEAQHAGGFWSRPGTPLPGAQPDVLRVSDGRPYSPHTVGRKGRAGAAREPGPIGTRLDWQPGPGPLIDRPEIWPPVIREPPIPRPPIPRPPAEPTRELARPAPRWFGPLAPTVAVRGARPSHRHHGDRLFDESGRLRCRLPSQCVAQINVPSVAPVRGSDLLPASALPPVGQPVGTDEVVREAVLLNPYGLRWLASRTTTTPEAATYYATHLYATYRALFGPFTTYDGNDHTGQTAPTTTDAWERWQERFGPDRELPPPPGVAAKVPGVRPSPAGVAAWRQPWVPLWLEWQVELDGTSSLNGWELGGIDLDRTPATPAPVVPGLPGPDVPRPDIPRPDLPRPDLPRPDLSDPGLPGLDDPFPRPLPRPPWETPPLPSGPVDPTRVSFIVNGRSPVGASAAGVLRESLRRWIDAERTRAEELELDDLAALIAPLDLVSASLDGIREQLLGLPYVGVLDRGSAAANPVATRAPTPLFGGTVRLRAARLVDAFGRTLDLPQAALDTAVSTVDLTTPAPGAMLMRPRLQHQARLLLRLVDAAPGADPAEASVNQPAPQSAANPVAGFFLPDHLDEELEAFTVAGEPIGQLGHDAISGGVWWEPAPGRPVPPDAGPLVDLDPHAHLIGLISAGLIEADARARALPQPPAASALTALLRVIDTTMWTVNSLGAVGTATVAGLVGRPVTVVRAHLRLESPSDVDDLDFPGPGGTALRAGREAVFARLADQAFPVRLGSLGRADDALLGFYVDDDYSRLHVVDQLVATRSLVTGRHAGQLGLLGQVQLPPSAALHHPYLVTDGILRLRPGTTVRLTLLMLPSGRLHVTSGILPRKQISIADDWVTPGLRKLVPSIRVGPVLVDPAEIRLPNIPLLGDEQTFTRRTGPLTWRDDAILAATQSAYLPETAHEAQEGWIRVTPATPDGGDDD